MKRQRGISTEEFYEWFFSDQARCDAYAIWEYENIGTTMGFIGDKLCEMALLVDDGVFEQWYMTIYKVEEGG